MSSQTTFSNLIKALTFSTTALACGAAVGGQPPAAATVSTGCSGAVVRGQAEVEALKGCTTVRGDLRVEGTVLESLAGLERLEIVTGTLRIANNPKLESLAGLENLRRVRSLVVSNNPELDSLQALGRLAKARHVVLHDLPVLEDLSGLGRLRSLESLIASRTGIYSTVGLTRMGEIQNLVITENSRLISLRGFGALRNASTLRISRNPRLAPDNGFLNGLERVSGPIVINDNPGLSADDVKIVLGRMRPEPRPVASR